MTDAQPTVEDEVERYLRTGETEPHHAAWSGGFLERANCAHDDLRGALAREVMRLAEGRTYEVLPQADSIALTRGKNPAERRALAEEYGSTVRISEERVDAAEVAGIVAEAAAARNGWKVILTRCAPTTGPLSARAQVKAARARAASDPGFASQMLPVETRKGT